MTIAVHALIALAAVSYGWYWPNQRQRPDKGLNVVLLPTSHNWRSLRVTKVHLASKLAAKPLVIQPRVIQPRVDLPEIQRLAPLACCRFDGHGDKVL